MRVRSLAVVAMAFGCGLGVGVYSRPGGEEVRVRHDAVGPGVATTLHVNEAFLWADPAGRAAAAESHCERHAIDSTNPVSVVHGKAIVGVVQGGRYVPYTD